MELKNEIKMELEDSIKEDLTRAILEHGRDYFGFEPIPYQVEMVANQLIENYLSDYLDLRALDRAFVQSILNEI